MKTEIEKCEDCKNGIRETNINGADVEVYCLCEEGKKKMKEDLKSLSKIKT